MQILIKSLHTLWAAASETCLSVSIVIRSNGSPLVWTGSEVSFCNIGPRTLHGPHQLGEKKVQRAQMKFGRIFEKRNGLLCIEVNENDLFRLVDRFFKCLFGLPKRTLSLGLLWTFQTSFNSLLERLWETGLFAQKSHAVNVQCRIGWREEETVALVVKNRVSAFAVLSQSCLFWESLCGRGAETNSYGQWFARGSIISADVYGLVYICVNSDTMRLDL
jgi:hypothetical protein